MKNRIAIIDLNPFEVDSIIVSTLQINSIVGIWQLLLDSFLNFCSVEGAYPDRRPNTSDNKTSRLFQLKRNLHRE